MYIQNLNPATITTRPQIRGRANVTWFNSREELLAEGWLQLDASQLPAPPEGYKTVEVNYEKDGEEAVGNHTYEPIPDTMPALIEKYGNKVMQLEGLLNTFGLGIPTTMDEAATVVHAACKEDLSLTPDGTLLMMVYNDLRLSLSNSEIHEIKDKMTETSEA